MLKRYEPRFLITGRYDWEELSAQQTTVSADVLDASYAESRANAAIVIFKGFYDESDTAFGWYLLGKKSGGPMLAIASGTGTLGNYSVDMDSDPVAEIPVYGNSLTITESDWYSTVTVHESTIGETTYYATLFFDMVGFEYLYCLCVPSATNGCTSIGADVTWF
jgi:hypothetical protein